MSRFRRPPPTSPDDAGIVELIASLGQQLEIPKLDVREVRWSKIVPVSRAAVPIPSDWCFLVRHAIAMPARMMGKLTIEEWRPLTNRAVCFRKKGRQSIEP